VPYTFLAALPAILALAGFVLYQLLGTQAKGDEVTKRIVAKLRQNAPSRIEKDRRLTGSQVEGLLEGDQELQKLIGDQDFQLLRQALHQQFVISLTVYSLAVLFCALSVGLFVRQAEAKKHLQIDHWSIASEDPNSRGVPVDLDTLEVSWQSSGDPEDVKAYLENVQTTMRTDPITVSSSEQKAEFQTASYRRILRNRERGQATRIRVIVQARDAVFRSDPVDLQVGITVLTVVDAESYLTIAAMIDNSRIPNYDFEAKVVVPPRSPAQEDLSLGPSIPYRFTPQRIARTHQLDWRSAKGVYIGPDDPRLVRFQFLIDESLTR
jgi:hypothetical protein